MWLVIKMSYIVHVMNLWDFAIATLPKFNSKFAPEKLPEKTQ